MTNEIQVNSTLVRDLNRAADKIRNPIVRDIVHGLIDSGRVNADDTIYLDKSLPASDYDRCVRGSIGGLLCERGVDHRVIKWFAKQGIEG